MKENEIKKALNLSGDFIFATIVLNGQLQIRGLRIMDSENGLYVGYPTDPFCREDFRHMVLPMTRQLREHIECVVLEKYQQAIG